MTELRIAVGISKREGSVAALLDVVEVEQDGDVTIATAYGYGSQGHER